MKNKPITYFTIIPTLLGMFLLSSCDDKSDPHAGHNHAPGEDHDHDHDHSSHTNKLNVRKAGPSGGRVLHKVEPHLEFFVTQDRKVQVTALNDSLKPIPFESQVIKITGGVRTNPISMNLVKQGNVMISDSAIPAGDDFPLVVQVKANSEAKSVYEKFTLNMSKCPTCIYLEYACTCDHGHGENDDHHDHKH